MGLPCEARRTNRFMGKRPDISGCNVSIKSRARLFPGRGQPPLQQRERQRPDPAQPPKPRGPGYANDINNSSLCFKLACCLIIATKKLNMSKSTSISANQNEGVSSLCPDSRTQLNLLTIDDGITNIAAIALSDETTIDDVSPMTAFEQESLLSLEETIEKGIHTFVQVGEVANRVRTTKPKATSNHPAAHAWGRVSIFNK